MHVPARTRGQPCLDLRVLVAGIVIDDAVHVQIRWHGLVDRAQERQKFLMPMARLALGQDGAVEHIQCREQGCGAVPNVVVRDAFDVSKAHRQQRLSALQGLTLALLVNAKNQRVLRRIQVQTDDVAQLFDEQRVSR